MYYSTVYNGDDTRFATSLCWWHLLYSYDPGSNSQRVYELMIEILRKLSLLWLCFQLFNYVTILHMTRQLSCRPMCKIMTWSDQYYYNKSNITLTRFGLWIRKPFCENGSQRYWSSSIGAGYWGHWCRHLLSQLAVYADQVSPCVDQIYQVVNRPSIHQQWGGHSLLRADIGMRPANERRCYIVTTSLIGWPQA